MISTDREIADLQITIAMGTQGHYIHPNHGKLYPESYWTAKLVTMKFWVGFLGFVAAAFFALTLLWWNVSRSTMRNLKTCVDLVQTR